MKVKVNGKELEVSTGTTIDSLVAQLGFSKIPVVVEHNREIVLTDDRAVRTVSEGDVIELIRFVGGG